MKLETLVSDFIFRTTRWIKKLLGVIIPQREETIPLAVYVLRSLKQYYVETNNQEEFFHWNLNIEIIDQPFALVFYRNNVGLRFDCFLTPLDNKKVLVECAGDWYSYKGVVSVKEIGRVVISEFLKYREFLNKE